MFALDWHVPSLTIQKEFKISLLKNRMKTLFAVYPRQSMTIYTKDMEKNIPISLEIITTRNSPLATRTMHK